MDCVKPGHSGCLFDAAPAPEHHRRRSKKTIGTKEIGNLLCHLDMAASIGPGQ